MEVNLCVYGKVYKTETKLSRKAQSEKVSLSVQDSSLNYVMFNTYNRKHTNMRCVETTKSFNTLRKYIKKYSKSMSSINPSQIETTQKERSKEKKDN